MLHWIKGFVIKICALKIIPLCLSKNTIKSSLTQKHTVYCKNEGCQKSNWQKWCLRSYVFHCVYPKQNSQNDLVWWPKHIADRHLLFNRIGAFPSSAKLTGKCSLFTAHLQVLAWVREKGIKERNAVCISKSTWGLCSDMFLFCRLHM